MVKRPSGRSVTAQPAYRCPRAGESMPVMQVRTLRARAAMREEREGVVGGTVRVREKWAGTSARISVGAVGPVSSTDSETDTVFAYCLRAVKSSVRREAREQEAVTRWAGTRAAARAVRSEVTSMTTERSGCQSHTNTTHTTHTHTREKWGRPQQ